LLEVSQAVSRQLNLPPELHAIVSLAGQLHHLVNQQPTFRATGLDGASFRTLLLNNLSPEIAKLLDPAQAAKIRAEQEARTNVVSAEAARAGVGFAQIVNGVWTGGVGAQSGGGTPTSKTTTTSMDYGAIAANFGIGHGGTLTGFTTQMFN